MTNRLPTRIAALLCATVAALLAACQPTQDAAVSQRFLYVVNCDGRVDKLDTLERKKVESFHLSARSGTPPAVPAAAGDRMDGCLVQRVTEGATTRGKSVSLIAPTAARVDRDGQQEFQLLTFSLPDWTLTEVKPAGKAPEAPRLQREAGGGLRLLRDDQWAPVTQLDLREYQGDTGQGGEVGGLIIASSGTVTLLSLLSAKTEQLALGLADQRARRLTRLTDLPPTTTRHVHLAPGGGFVLVEGTQGNAAAVKRTGALRLYDGSGKAVAEWQDERIRNMAWVALTGNGLAVYSALGEYHFIDMGRGFGNAAVTTPLPELAAPGLVFAGQ